MTALVRQTQNLITAPSSSTKATDLLTARLTNALEPHPTDFRLGAIPASRAPTDEQRAHLEQRRAELEESLVPTPGEATDDVILAIIAGSPLFGLSDEEAALKTNLYAEALADLPTWSIDKARRIFGKGGWRCMWDGKGCPSSAMVAAECRYILLPIETELRRLKAVLDAEVYEAGAGDQQRVEAVDHWWNEVQPEIQRDPGILQRTDDEIAAEASEMERVNERFREWERTMAAIDGRGSATWGRLPLSDELARRIGLQVPRPVLDAGGA